MILKFVSFVFLGEGNLVFNLNQDRSFDGSPSLSVTFPNGQEDNLILDEHSTCNYIGTLEHERDACVAMTGCLGEGDVHFTILSKHLPAHTTMKWSKDGSVELFEDSLVTVRLTITILKVLD